MNCRLDRSPVVGMMNVPLRSFYREHQVSNFFERTMPYFGKGEVAHVSFVWPVRGPSGRRGARGRAHGGDSVAQWAPWIECSRRCTIMVSGVKMDAGLPIASPSDAV